MAEGDDAFDFADFISSPPPQPQPRPSLVNGFSSTPQNDDDLWGSFLSSPASNHPTTHPKPDPSPARPDPSPGITPKRGGALPLSLFGEEVEDEEIEQGGDTHHGFNDSSKLNGWHDSNKAAHNGKLGDSHQQIVAQIGSGFDSGNSNGGGGFDDDDDDDDDDWEFKGAFPGNGVAQGNLQGVSAVVAGAKVEPIVGMTLENQAGQDASTSNVQNPGFSGLLPQSYDLFSASDGALSNTSEKDVKPRSTAVMTNGLMWDAFPVVEGNGSAHNLSYIRPKPDSSSVLQSDNLFAVPNGVLNKSSDLEYVGFKATTATNGFEWGAFTGVEKIIDGSRASPAAISSVNHIPVSSFLSPSDDLFVLPEGAVSKSSETDVRPKPTTNMSTSSTWDAFSGVEKINDIGAIATARTVNSIEHLPGSSSYFPPSDDLFSAQHGGVNKSTEKDIELKTTAVTSNNFMSDAFSGVQEVGIGNQISAHGTSSLIEGDDFDDFGDFVDASREFVPVEKEQVMTQRTVAEAQSPSGKPQDNLTQPGHGRGALPLSLFGDDTEESSEILNHPDEFIHTPTSNQGYSLSGQSNVVSIHDLISNLYSQGQNAPSGQQPENDVCDSKEEGSPSLDGMGEDDDWEDDSWEFKGAIPGSVVKEQAAVDRITANSLSQTSQKLQQYIAFYTKLKDSLCFLLSCQIDELKKAQSLDAETSAEFSEATNGELQELLKLLEQSMIPQNGLSDNHLERSSCLNEVLETLQGPDFLAIESEYSLSKKLQLAANEWRVAADLLRHAITVLKCLSLGSADEQFQYVSSWSKIINVCAQELRYGASIWKRASEKKVHDQVLSDCRGKRHVQALGEIYKVVELVGLSVKVYKAWMLLSMSDITGLLDECRTLWSSSGLKEVLKSLSDDNEFECDENAKALVAFSRGVCDFDVLAIHDHVCGQHKSICQLSLLPPEIFSDLKTVLWDGKPYFLSLANLWANLISRDSPQLPHLLFS